MKENLLARIWKGQWLNRGELLTAEGKRLTILFPGRENRDEGPDFLDASLLIEGELVRGDVELHLRSRDWKAHRHHRDPHYNSVILQVVLSGEPEPAVLSSGEIIPTLVLQDYLNGSLEELSLRQVAFPLMPCQGVGLERDGRTLKVLEQVGEERFCLKAASFEVKLVLEEAPEVLYQGMMRTLGYARNKESFQELARRLPLSVLESLAQEGGERRMVFQALLLGAAGLLPSRQGWSVGLREVVPLDKLEQVWNSLGVKRVLDEVNWHFFRVRPHNFPTRRLLAVGHLLDRYHEQGLFEGMLSLLNHSNPCLMEEGLLVRLDQQTLLGPDRAREIVVNVLLPFFFAWAELNTRLKLRKTILEFYAQYPRLEENQITRHMGWLLWGEKGRVLSAQQQQGLIHLYQTFCLSQRCQVCPLAPEDSAPDL